MTLNKTTVTNLGITLMDAALGGRPADTTMVSDHYTACNCPVSEDTTPFDNCCQPTYEFTCTRLDSVCGYCGPSAICPVSAAKAQAICI